MPSQSVKEMDPPPPRPPGCPFTKDQQEWLQGRGLPVSLPPTGVPPGSATLSGVTGPVTLEAPYPALNPALIPGLPLPSLTVGAPSFPTALPAAIPITTAHR